ncbi:fatty acid desaturase [Amycolatopsis sp. WQ 127309]|uniref:fatty acid desaturase n=1 Tax=Amycolatopsis sp. WQ 127309 TaxID=2932773 RepID=UPI001FF16C8A|nr:fatty acid desaturase [Amycolatopsis sp. WQ 127309]UOZ06558.1 fatty acid desaturase [Amycolatopsis sp. WQ 127309]
MSVVDTPARGSLEPARGLPSPRAVPAPRLPLPSVSVPAVLLFAGALAVWVTSTWLLPAGLVPAVVTVVLNTAVTFAMYTVVHESAHHSAGKLTWVNETLGRLAVLFVAAYASFPSLRYVHGEHHRHTNASVRADPDAWTSRGPAWLLPLRWLTLDVSYARCYVSRLRVRPPHELAETLVVLSVAVSAGVALVAAGHGPELVLVYLLPQRLGVGLLAWAFGWLPHHGLPAAGPRGRFGTTRVRVGLDRLLTPVLLAQNLHLVHHLHPAVPFHRYRRVWLDNREAYLARDVPISTVWGRDLTTAQYRAEAGLTGGPDDAVPAPAPPPPGPSRFHRLRVADVRPLTADAVAVTFDVPPDLAAEYRFTPGQHVAVRAVLDGQPVRRTYSICAPAGSGDLRIVVKRRPGGAFSGFATTALTAGQFLDVLPPSGGFTLVPDPARSAHYVALAAGSGITPVLSIVVSALRAEPHSRATLLYVNTSGATTLFAAELTTLAEGFGGRLHVVHYRTDERDPDLHAHRPVRHFDAVGEALAISHERYQRGRLDGTRLRALLQNRLHPAKVDEWFLCGPRGLTDLARRTLADADVPEEDVHFELFRGAAPLRDPAGFPAEVTVTLGATTTRIAARAGETVLDAALRAGFEVPYSCTGGACGTCRATLLQGQVDMDVRYALTVDDVAVGRILTCRARATTPEVAVDYDR